MKLYSKECTGQAIKLSTDIFKSVKVYNDMDRSTSVGLSLTKSQTALCYIIAF